MVYSSANASNLRQLDVVYNKAVRPTCGAYRTIPIATLYRDTNYAFKTQKR